MVADFFMIANRYDTLLSVNLRYCLKVYFYKLSLTQQILSHGCKLDLIDKLIKNITKSLVIGKFRA